MNYFSLFLSIYSNCRVILVKPQSRWLRTGHTTSNRRRFDVYITLIRRKENINKFPHDFDVLFSCNFDGRKIIVVLTYFLRCKFDDWKIGLVSTYFLRCNFDEQKIDVFSACFVKHNFNEQNIHRRFDVLFSTWFWWRKNQRCFCVFLVQLRWNCAYFDVILKFKKSWLFWFFFLISFLYVKN